MRLRERREKVGTQRDFAKAIELQGIKLDKPDVSRLESGKYLPTVDMLRAICKVLECEVLDIYDKEEVDLLNALKPVRADKVVRLTDRHKVSARLNESCCNSLKAALRERGLTIQAWIERCAEREIRFYEKRRSRTEVRQAYTEVHAITSN